MLISNKICNDIHVGLFCKFTSNCSTEIYATPLKLKGTKKCNHEKGQIVEFYRVKPTVISEKDLTIH